MRPISRKIRTVSEAKVILPGKIRTKNKAKLKIKIRTK